MGDADPGDMNPGDTNIEKKIVNKILNSVIGMIMFLSFLGGAAVMLTGGDIVPLANAPAIVRIGLGLAVCYGVLAGFGILRFRWFKH